MENCHTKFWAIVATIAFLITMIGLYISVSSLIRVEAKVDSISTTLNEWGIE